MKDMCWQCDHVKKEITRLEGHLAKVREKLHDRKRYFKAYYSKNREKKLQAAKERYHAKKHESITQPELTV